MYIELRMGVGEMQENALNYDSVHYWVPSKEQFENIEKSLL